MPNLNITEYSGISRASGQASQIVQLPPIATQNVALTTSSAQSSALNSQTRIIRLETDVVCFVEVGVNPTALATSLTLPAGSVEYFAVGAGMKIAARS